ncbi:hypothetical protein ACA081_00590, partial [Candidatus Hodgkinia cicadicola]
SSQNWLLIASNRIITLLSFIYYQYSLSSLIPVIISCRLSGEGKSFIVELTWVFTWMFNLCKVFILIFLFFAAFINQLYQ